jgi:site-specific DNA-methyltransferase (adenine-specific)/adenine-specific DNA-methyltransferase
MPNLTWTGKDAVVRHHLDVPFRLLKADSTLSSGNSSSGNLIVQGDNLVALKALLPYYGGTVKCIYIDPPYNTGNEKWVYNDNVNSPEIRAWLGDVVGREAEDLNRHDKWLCMMYPRLRLLQEFLRPDGAIFISIDDNEVANLKLLMDEIFGPKNFVATIIWQKNFSPKNSAKHFSEDHDYILVYSPDAEHWRPNLVPRGDRQAVRYQNPDDDPRGPWTSGDLSARNFYSLGTYPITTPSGRVIPGPPKGTYWRVSKETFDELDRDKRIWWGKSGANVPRLKRFLSEVQDGIVPQTLWMHSEVGNTQEAKKELLQAVPNAPLVFITPKPTRLITRILQLATEKDSLVMDSFAGSGATGHAVLKTNKADGGTRRFILIEIEERVCQDVTAERVKYAVQTEGGGGFQFCTLGPEMFTERGEITKHVSFDDLARHIFFAETGTALCKPKARSPLLGVHGGTAYYLLFNGVLGDQRPDGGNVLTPKILQALPPHKGPKVIYGEGRRVSESRLQREGILFKQIPYQIRTR